MSFVGDTQTIQLTLVDENSQAVDISSATKKQIKLCGPSGTVTAYDAEFVTDGTDGKIKYTCSVAVLSESGRWRAQGYIEMPSWTGHTEIYEFDVKEPL